MRPTVLIKAVSWGEDSCEFLGHLHYDGKEARLEFAVDMAQSQRGQQVALAENEFRRLVDALQAAEIRTTPEPQP